LLSKDSGDLAFEAGEGSVQVTRTATPQLQPNAIPEQQFTLADNDAAFFPAGYETIERPEADTELVLMRLLIEPSESLANAPAIVSTIQPGDASETADVGEQDVEGFGIGAIVELNEDGVRVRQEATTDSNIVDGFTAGTQFELVDGPVEGESFTWYAVQGVGDLSDVEGWLVTDFMDIVEPAPADGQAASSDGSAGSEDTPTEGDATPAAATTEAAQPAVDLAVGDLVVTSDDNVRIRFEPDTGTDIVIALATGTELEVIGGPEENQDFTWYEVQVVDSDTTGWTVAEFLAPADSSEEDTEG
jgi:hypothetical protein